MFFDTTLIITNNTVLAGTLLFVIGAWFFFGRRDKPARESLSAFLLYFALWLMAFSLNSQSDGELQRLVWIRLLYIGASFLPVFLIIMVKTLVAGKAPSQRFQFLLTVPSVAFIVFTFAFPLLVTEARAGLGLGPAVWVLKAHFVTMLAAAIAEGITGFRSLRKQIGHGVYFLLVGSIAALAAVYVVLEGMTLGSSIHDTWLGGVAAVTMLSGGLLVVYGTDHDDFLARMRLVGLEIFMLVLLLAMVLNVVITTEYMAFSFRLALMLCLLFYGAFAVRSFSREVGEIMEKQRLHKDLIITNDELLKADRTKTRLLSFASHQLRAILSGIRNYLDMLNNGDFGALSEKQKTITGITLTATDRLGDTVETFLDVALEEGGTFKVRLVKENVDIRAFVQRAVREFTPMATKKNISLTWDVDNNTPDLYCDPRKLYHALANLVNNSISYTNRGGIMVTARRSDDNMINIEVTDTGIGLDAIAKKHVDDLLVRGLEAVKFETSSGSGLGLHVAKVIVDAHNGNMYFLSRGKGKGSTFGFNIPIIYG